MAEVLDPVTQLLTQLVVPSLESVQADQTQQIELLQRIERSVQDLRRLLDSQFVQMKTQLTACRAELAATQAMLRAAGIAGSQPEPSLPAILH